jgi:hypothetical protein
MLLVLYIYLLIQLWRAGEKKEKLNQQLFEKLRRERMQTELDRDRLMRNIAYEMRAKLRNKNSVSVGYSIFETRESIENQIKEAIEKEDYERAAKLRDML